MDINSFVTGFAMGKKNAKKPILTELVVTENGVYDEPMIAGGPEPITWDGVVGDRVTAKSGEEVMYTKLSDKVVSADDLVGSTIVTNNEQKIILDSTVVLEMGDVILATELVVVAPKANATFPMGSETVTFPEAGIYFFGVAPAFYVTSLTFPSVPPTPADGWNKVTVNVAGDIIDVPELPTENIEEGKIYRVVDNREHEFWVIGGSPDVQKVPLTTMWAALGATMTVIPHVVDVLPDTMDMMTQNPNILPAYILRDSGIGYITMDGTSATVKTMGEMAGAPDGGWIDSVDDVVGTETAIVYTVRGRTSTTYGIPNANPVKRLVDGAWVELT